MTLFNQKPTEEVIQNSIQKIDDILNTSRDKQTPIQTDLLDAIEAHQADDGSWSLIEDPSMPADARWEFIYQPTAYVTAILMAVPETLFAERPHILGMIKRGLHFLSSGKIGGRGYDRIRGYLDITEIYIDPSVFQFLIRYPSFIPKGFKRYIETLKETLESIQSDEKTDWFCGAEERDMAEKLLKKLDVIMANLLRMLPEEKLYIAYGSNIDLEQMAYRCPNARVIGAVSIPGFVLSYRQSSSGYYASLDKADRSETPGLLWAITAADEANLDLYEGVSSNCYYKMEIPVVLAGQRLMAMTYLIPEERPAGEPSSDYRNVIHRAYENLYLPLSSLI